LILRLSSEVDCIRFEFPCLGAGVLEAMLKTRTHGTIIGVAVLSLDYQLASIRGGSKVNLATTRARRHHYAAWPSGNYHEMH
jgi:hypothetical protein